jgi:hypothetical protein
LPNEVRKINDLAHKPSGYRYTIPQGLFQQVQYLIRLCCTITCDGNSQVPSRVAPFYSLGPGFGKRAARRFLRYHGRPPRPFCDAV